MSPSLRGQPLISPSLREHALVGPFLRARPGGIPSFRGRPRVIPSVVATLLLIVAVGCGERYEVPSDEAAVEGEAGRPGVATPARYVTTLAFTGTGSSPLRLYARFANRTGTDVLERNYAAWLAEDGVWRRLLSVRDTLPTPRADWRILPAPGLRVIVGDGADVPGLVWIPDASSGADPDSADAAGGRPVRWTPASLAAEWTGLTGQRELLGVGSIRSDDDVQPGLFFFRRAARPAAAPASRDADRVLLLADTVGNAMLIEGNAGGPDSTVTVWAWLQGVESSWPEVVLASTDDADGESAREASDARGASALGDAGGSPRGWTFEVPALALSATIRVTGSQEGSEPSGPFLRLERLFLLEADARLNQAELHFRGLGLESPLP